MVAVVLVDGGAAIPHGIEKKNMKVMATSRMNDLGTTILPLLFPSRASPF